MVKSTKSETAPAVVAASTKSAETKPAKTPKSAEPKVAAVAAPTEPKTEKAAKAPKAEKVAAAPAEPKVAAEAKAPKSAKKAAAVPAEVVAAPAAADVPAVEAAAAEVVSVTSDFAEYASKLQQLGTLISSLKTEFRTLEKKALRELKTAAKASHKRKRKTGNRSPSGFVKPTLISDELAAFLGKGKGTQMARTEVTREINAYIRANQLQDKTNGRRINADTQLASLLKLASGEELTYFNLQRYMSPHFAKSTAVVATA
jgi:chromatin remodeling complex protein RSC6